MRITRSHTLKKSFDYEIFEECWIQLPRQKYISMKCLDTMHTIGIKKEEIATSLASKGGNVSVRLPKGSKPKIIFGQDEAIFRSSQLNNSCWTVDGKTTLRTKGLGTGLMISAMVSQWKRTEKTTTIIPICSISKLWRWEGLPKVSPPRQQFHI